MRARKPHQFLLPAVATLTLAVGLSGQNVEAPERYATARASIAQFVADDTTPSIAVAVHDGGRTIWAEGFGLADREREIPADADTIYRLASISKPFTATAIMQLVDLDKITLDEPVNRYLGDIKMRAFRGTADRITVRRLLNHTSGLPTHWNFYYTPETPPGRDESIRQFGFAAFEPGTRTNYSNFAFGVLDHVIARHSGKSFRDWLVTELCDPLGMAHTDVGVRPGQEQHAAVGYRAENDEWQPVVDYGFDHDGASAIRSSANDLMRFARLQFGRGAIGETRLLQEATALAMRERRGHEAGSNFGIGWSVGEARGKKVLRHSGGMPGVSTQLLVFPEIDFAVTVLTNSSNRRPTNQAVKAILDARFGEQPAGNPWNTAVGGAPARRLRGTFRGMMSHLDGALSVRVQFGLMSTIAIGAGRPTPIERVPRAHRTWRCTHPLALGHGASQPTELAFEIKESTDDRLAGICYATLDGTCRLPFWFELHRSQTKRKSTFRVITHNVLVGFRDSEVGRFLPGCQRQARLGAWLAAQRPDVVALQELNGFDEDRLRRTAQAWGHEHVAMLKEDGYPVGLTSSAPITVVKRHLQGLHHGMLHVHTHGMDFVVVHYPPMPGLTRKVAESARALACHRLAAGLGHETVVLGDFNSIQTSDVARYSDEAKQRYEKWRYLQVDGRPAEFAIGPLLDRGFVDVVAAADTLPGAMALPRIDFLLASPALAARCQTATWLATPDLLELSDHPPVVADFTRPATAVNRK
ncbi:MAG: serine hydrolase [bacterium]|nr:serine hydrolase [bacterium]